MATTTILIGITGSSPNEVVSYTYNGQTSTTCTLTDEAGVNILGQPKPDPDTFIFQLDPASIAAGWTMTNYLLGSTSSPLTVSAGSATSGNTSYTVQDSDSPTSGGPYSVIFEYTNTVTLRCIQRDPEVSNEEMGAPPPLP